MVPLLQHASLIYCLPLQYLCHVCVLARTRPYAREPSRHPKLHALAPCGVLMRCLVKRQVDVVVKGMEARQRVSVATVDGAVRIATSGLEAIAVVTGHLAVAVVEHLGEVLEIWERC